MQAKGINMQMCASRFHFYLKNNNLLLLVHNEVILSTSIDFACDTLFCICLLSDLPMRPSFSFNDHVNTCSKKKTPLLILSSDIIPICSHKQAFISSS
jgi:hypothetical protein